MGTQAPHGAICGHEVTAMMPPQFTHQQSGFYNPIVPYSQPSLQPMVATAIPAANGSVSFVPSLYANPTATVPTQYTQLPAQPQKSMRQQSFCEPAQKNTVINKADPARDDFQTSHEVMMQTQHEQQIELMWISQMCPRVIVPLGRIKHKCNYQREQDILGQFESELREVFYYWANEFENPELALIITAFAEEHVQAVREAQKQAGRVCP